MALATREELRSQIEARYSFALHVFSIHAITLATIGVSLFYLRDLRQVELLTIPIAFSFANVLEYVFHRWPMHHRFGPLAILFERHTVIHHAYFRSDSMGASDRRDMRFVLFPAVAALTVISLASGGAYLISLTWGRNVGLLFIATATFYYLIYEWFHASFHLAGEERLRRIPILGSAARRHRIHHDPERMTKVNFNITFPVVDLLAGTKSET